MFKKATLIFISIVAIALSIYFVGQQVLGVAIGGNLNMSNNKIVNLGTPTANTDASTKAYVDTAVAGAGGSPADWDCQIVEEPSSTFAAAFCPAGTTLVWGYCRSSITYLDYPWQSGGQVGWACRNGEAGGGQAITAYAICCQ